MVKEGAWVTVESTVLKAGERAQNLPGDTGATDLRMWIKGTLVKQTDIGQEATVLTVTGRKESGTLVEVNPSFAVGYGSYVPELRMAGDMARECLHTKSADKDGVVKA